MEYIIENLPFLIPVAIIQLVRAIIALIHVVKHPNYKLGSKHFWIIVVIFVNIIGPIIYFVFGRDEE